jgi:hypothetical protein
MRKRKISPDRALYMAAEKGELGKVRKLLSAGANVHAWNDAAIEIAALNGRQKMVAVLAGWIFREAAWKGRLPLDAIREAERLSAKLENSVSLEDCKGNAVATGALKGAAAGVALIMEYGAAAAKRLRGADK